MSDTARDSRLSRRAFLGAASAGAGASWLRLTGPAVAAIAQAACTAREHEAAFVLLTGDEAADLAALAARIIPTTDTPGATEAGVVHFFDQAFANEMRGALELARSGLAELNDGAAGRRFAELNAQAQDAALAALEGQPFFELVRVMTIFGFFAMSDYGGNRDHVGWQVIGFDGQHGAWRYPFGHYDAAVHKMDADDD